jgi:hypothetical protein
VRPGPFMAAEDIRAPGGARSVTIPRSAPLRPSLALRHPAALIPLSPEDGTSP